MFVICVTGLVTVEISDYGKLAADSNDKLAYHLSCSQLQYENVKDEMDLLSWQNGYTEDPQYICMQKSRFQKLNIIGCIQELVIWLIYSATPVLAVSLVSSVYKQT